MAEDNATPNRPPRHPMQPTVTDDRGVRRFKSNAIVVALLEHAKKTGLDLNALTRRGFSHDDWRQFSQLHGYSVSGCPYLSDVDLEAANDTPDGEDPRDKRIEVLEWRLSELRSALAEPMSLLFEVAQEDLLHREEL